MSSELLADLVNATVTVQQYLGVTGNGGSPVLGDPITVPGWLTRKQQFVRDGNGDQVTSQASFSAAVDYADAFAPQSVVTVPGENPTTVISRQVSSGGNFVEGLDRVKAFLQ